MMAWDDVVAMVASEERTGWPMAAVLPWRKEGLMLPEPVMHGLARRLFQKAGMALSGDQVKHRQDRPTGPDTKYIKKQRGAPFAAVRDVGAESSTWTRLID